MTGLLDVIRAARRPERSIELCLRGDLVARHEELGRRLKETVTRRDDAFGGSGDARRYSEEQKALEVEMRGSTVTLHLRALGPTASADLLAGHPPRADDTQDTRVGYNRATYYPALVKATCYAITRGEDRLTLLDDTGRPADDAMTGEDWDRLLDALSNQQWERLLAVVWDLDHTDIEVPTSPLASLISQRGDESSEQHSAGDSHQATSTAGSDGR